MLVNSNNLHKTNHRLKKISVTNFAMHINKIKLTMKYKSFKMIPLDKVSFTSYLSCLYATLSTSINKISIKDLLKLF